MYSAAIKEALTLMPRDVLVNLNTVLSTVDGSLQTLKVSKQALSTAMDIALIPSKAQKVALNAVIDTVKQNTKIIPSDAIILAPELGKINTYLETALTAPIEGAVNAVFEIDRLTSIQAEVTATISEIEEAINFIADIKDAIQDILSS